MRRICVVSGSRADYGYLRWPIRLIGADSDLSLQVVVTGTHLAPEFGATWREIEADGIRIDARVDSLVAGDTPAAIAKSIGLGVIGFADVLQRLAPDFLLVLGDRFEIFAAVQAALIARIPVAHLCGGDVSEGAFDEALRHSITKMAHVHFVSNGESGRRVRQLGEDPAYIHVVGSPSLDQLRHLQPRSKADVFKRLGLQPRAKNLMVTYHPVTLSTVPSRQQLEVVLAALADLPEDVGLIVTAPNADTEGRELLATAQGFARGRTNAVFHKSLGHDLYLNTLRHVDAVVGNSSSGIYEAPSLGIPTVNIGDRQKGRLQATSVLNCPVERHAIHRAIMRALALDCAGTVNPYGDGTASARIIAVLKAIPNPHALLQKRFHDATAHRASE